MGLLSHVLFPSTDRRCKPCKGVRIGIHVHFLGGGVSFLLIMMPLN